MRRAYLFTLAQIVLFGLALACLWDVGILPALHLSGWESGITACCAGWAGGVISFRVFEPWLDKIDRANAYVREMQAIMDRERARV